MSDLRTRIAAALWKFAQPERLPDAALPEVFLSMADAVIRELALEKQTLNREMWAAAPNVCRYVTDWKADDE